MKKSQIISLVTALVLVAVTIVLILLLGATISTTALSPFVYICCAVAVLIPIVCTPIIKKVEKYEEEGK